MEFIDNLEKKEYDKPLILLKEDLRFAVAMANVGKQFPDLRRKIIENLRTTGTFRKINFCFSLIMTKRISTRHSIFLREWIYRI